MLTFKIKDFFAHLSGKRIENSEKYKLTNFFLAVLFPIFIVCLAEINQMKAPSKLVLFISEKPSIMLFNIMVAAIIYGTLLFLFRRAFPAALFTGLLYFIFSTVELFKFGTSGNHFEISDLKMSVDAENIARFAYIKITPELVFYAVLLIAYLSAVFWFRPVLKISRVKGFLSSAACLLCGGCMILLPSVAMPVYAFFEIDTTEADNVFKVNEKFDNNSFLAFFTESATETVKDRVKEPEDYTAETVENIIEDSVAKQNPDLFQMPNVIVVMSEAFTDFRRFDGLEIPEETYADWDKACSEGYVGKAVVPTFASFTVRTEFELLFGLPLKSLNDPNMPQRLLLDRPQQTMAKYYKELGYKTAYVHTFLSSFYSRAEIYKNFGFDEMYFEESLTVPVKYDGSYISDSVIYDQIQQMLMENKNTPVYVHTTTMENHQPYDTEGKTEFEEYLSRVQKVLKNFRDFTEELKSVDRPTIVLMVGDHLPCFRGEGNVYSQLGIDGDNCSTLYEQPYLLWSNYGADFSKVPNEEISSFYLPYVLMDAAGVPLDSMAQTMLDKMREVPVYSTSYNSSIPHDKELDMITYDRILGDNISGNAQ